MYTFASVPARVEAQQSQPACVFGKASSCWMSQGQVEWQGGRIDAKGFPSKQSEHVMRKGNRVPGIKVTALMMRMGNSIRCHK